jgi:hypothetical protein
LAATPGDDGPGPAVVLPAADVPESEPKSKLLSVPNTGCAESLLGWLGGGLLSKTGLKSSRPEREMLAKSSSAEPSFASSRPSKSSSRSSNGALEAVAAVVGRLALLAVAPAGWCVVKEPKMSSTLEELRLLRWEEEEAVGTGLSLCGC